MKKNTLFILVFIFTVCNMCAQVSFIWGKQFGTSSDEKARGLATDIAGNIYISGKTKGKIGSGNFGKNDGFVVKIDSSSNTIWTTQIGTKNDDDILEIVVDVKGNTYLTGYIGEHNNDILVAKLDPNGIIMWQKQFGTDSLDIGQNIAVSDNGDIYVIGHTKGNLADTNRGKEDCFILHLDNEGKQLNVIQFGTSGTDYGGGIMINNNSECFVYGATEGDLACENFGESDIFWGVFSSELKMVRIKQYGTIGDDNATSIVTDSNNNVYIAGSTYGDLGVKNKGNGDCFLLKLNKKGEKIWAHQFGTENWDGINGLKLFNDNNILVSGCQHYAECQSFCIMYDKDGNMLWKRDHIAQGDGGGTCGKGVCIDSKGNIYHTGYTGANMFSTLNGEHDIFLLKLKTE